MSIPIRNPRTGENDYVITPPAPTELSALAQRLRAGQSVWAALGPQGRAEVMQVWKANFSAARDEIFAALAADTGRVIETRSEVDYVPATIDRWCRNAPDLLKTTDLRDSALPWVKIRNAFIPYQLVGIISPWNFPLLLSLIDAIPALLAGCAVIIKPSEVTPRFIAPLLRTIEATPVLRDVLAYIPGAGDTGSALIEQVDVLCFTGSVPTGRKVGEAAAKRFIPAFLELGGKDPAIILRSADLDKATSAVLWGGVANVGHSCMSIERVYVDRAIYGEFVEQLTDKASKIKLAYPDIHSGHLGPIIAERQVGIIQSHLDDARAGGAHTLCGGEIEQHGGGYWLRPTVMMNVRHTMKLMREETFAPIMPVMPFDTVDEAVALANDTAFGLSAGIMAGTVDEALAIAPRIQAGGISINDICLTAMMHEGEKQSFKFSGLGGSRMGAASIRRFVRAQSHLVNTGTADPWWFKL